MLNIKHFVELAAWHGRCNLASALLRPALSDELNVLHFPKLNNVSLPEFSIGK